MAKKSNFMSEKLKEEIAKELGVYDEVKKERWMEQCII